MIQTDDAPVFCSKCGKRLHATTMKTGFDPYSGKEKTEDVLTCTSLIDYHDTYALKPIHFDMFGPVVYCWELK